MGKKAKKLAFCVIQAPSYCLLSCSGIFFYTLHRHLTQRETSSSPCSTFSSLREKDKMDPSFLLPHSSPETIFSTLRNGLSSDTGPKIAFPLREAGLMMVLGSSRGEFSSQVWFYECLALQEM